MWRLYCEGHFGSVGMLLLLLLSAFELSLCTFLSPLLSPLLLSLFAFLVSPRHGQRISDSEFAGHLTGHLDVKRECRVG